MSTKYIASNWRLPNEENSNKSDNYGLSFDGTEFIDIGVVNEVNSATACTLSYWGKKTASNKYLLFGSQITSKNGIWLVWWSDGNVYFSPRNGANSSASYALSFDTNWHHFVGVYDGSSAKIYIDGNLVSTSTTSIPASLSANAGNDFNIGYLSLGSLYTDGEISEVAVFDYALSESQISTLYGSSSLGAGNPMALKPQPVAYYPLGDNSASNPLTQPNEAVEDASVFDFSGSNQWIDCGIDSSIDTGNLSVAFWFNKDSSASGFQYVFNSGSGSAKAGFVFAFSGTNIYIGRKTRTHTAGFTTYTNIGISADKWHHIALTYNDTSNNFIAYLDGQSVHTSTGTTATNAASSEIIFGRISNVASAYYKGKVSNAQIWTTELSSSEVTTLYNSGVPLTGTQPQEANLKAWYKLDQSANWEADTSGAWQIPDAVSAYPQSFSFDGSDDYIRISDNNSLSFGDGTTDEAFTLSIWANLNDVTNAFLFAKRGSSNNREYQFNFASNNKLYFTLYSQLSGSYISRRVDTDLSSYENQWIHLVATYDGSSTVSGIKIYINGSQEDNATGSIGTYIAMSNGQRDLILGSFSSDYLDGELSNAQIWQAELSSTQVETLYNNGTPLTTAIASDNLKLWAKLDNTATFSTNWSIPDASGNGNTGTSLGMTEQNLVYNNVSALNGESNGMTSASLVLSDLTRAVPYDSYSFNLDSASSDYIDCGNDSTFDLNNAFSISTWIKYTSTSAMVVLSKRETTKIGLLIELGSGKPFTAIRDASSNIAITNTYSGTYNDGNWHHIVATFDRTANELKLYVDNELKETANTSSVGDIAPTTNNLMIGRRSDTSSSYFDGKISNISLFNETLTSTEVQKLYANGVPQDLANFTPQPVAWYTLGSNSFWNGSNWICRDLIGSNDGTSANAGADAIVGDAPRSEANGTGTNMDIPTNLEGSTKWSSNNSWSINMSSTARTIDVP